MRDPAESPTAPLVVESVTKRFRQGETTVEALRNVTLRVSPGEFVAVMGASGSGKSTLLHVMSGLTRTDGGRILVEGQAISDLSDARLTDFRRRRIGLVFQQFNLISALTAIQNVMLPLLAEGGRAGDDAQKRATELLERLGLGHRVNHRPDAMSGGEQQRVAIARALVTDPAIIMADEPTGSLDSINGKALCTLLQELNEREKRAIVVVTHEPAVAAWAQRIVVMKDGAICADFRSSEFQDAHALAGHYQDIVASPALEAVR
ncbi:Lipoprotein-releasing system ATP-binding protein LolD [Caulifigura coniformis]|uniref:Lipoprotein-releasing system ATP-binding protein LolD n=1 Tax=Caulifigura coniformis TaxID=2527983 RepID=A0A517S923_9PLAN|nr:ABC transporter ATP-binding protein [Caulifigura coniformis]QDT52630.1 Lipoprotein-releasing system ATP-binding protein LolD [Caulifigura coniformis]